METCKQCGGTGKRATAKTANGRDLDRHEGYGTPCDICHGTGQQQDPAVASDVTIYGAGSQ